MNLRHLSEVLRMLMNDRRGRWRGGRAEAALLERCRQKVAAQNPPGGGDLKLVGFLSNNLAKLYRSQDEVSPAVNTLFGALVHAADKALAIV